MTIRNDYVINYFCDDKQKIEKNIYKIYLEYISGITEKKLDIIKDLYQKVKALKYAGQGYIESFDHLEEKYEYLINIGYVNALIDSMQKYIQKLDREDDILKVNTKYKQPILKALGMKGCLLHKDLAAWLGISTSALNAVIGRMNRQKTKLINIECVSKYKLYSLTPAAYQYAKKNGLLTDPEENIKKKAERRDISNNMENLQIMLKEKSRFGYNMWENEREKHEVYKMIKGFEDTAKKERKAKIYFFDRNLKIS